MRKLPQIAPQLAHNVSCCDFMRAQIYFLRRVAMRNFCPRVAGYEQSHHHVHFSVADRSRRVRAVARSNRGPLRSGETARRPPCRHAQKSTRDQGQDHSLVGPPGRHAAQTCALAGLRADRVRGVPAASDGELHSRRVLRRLAVPMKAPPTESPKLSSRRPARTPGGTPSDAT